MSTNTKLYDAIEYNNKIENKAWFNANLEAIKAIYDFYDVEYNFDNILDIIKNINVINGHDNDIVSYDYKTNTLVLGNSQKNREYNLFKSFLQITSQKGIVRYSEDGHEYWQNLNNIIIDRLILDTTGIRQEEIENENIYELSENDEKRSKEDELLFMINSIVPSKTLINCFVNQKGDELYSDFFKERNINTQVK